MKKRPGQKLGGSRPIVIWIDGERFASACDAKAYLNFRSKRQQAWNAALRGECLYDGHVLSRFPPPTIHGRELVPPRIYGSPLIVAPVTHRLGVYHS